jgi:hypothetical protein
MNLDKLPKALVDLLSPECIARLKEETSLVLTKEDCKKISAEVLKEYTRSSNGL